MPIYLYRSSDPQACKYCREGFEKLQKLSAVALDACPRCSAPVEKVIARVNIAAAGPSLDRGNLEKHGFTQYRKLEKGVYEKSAGEGPDIISDEDS